MNIAVFHDLPSGGAKRALYGNVKFLVEKNDVDVFIPSTANEDYLPLKDIVNNLKIFPVKNISKGFLISAIKYFPSRVSLLDLEKTQKNMAEIINKEDYDVVLCEQDRFTMAPFFLKYLKKPHVFYCQQQIDFRYDVTWELYKNAGLIKKNLPEYLRYKFYSSRMKNNDKKISEYSKYTVVNSNFSQETLLKSYGIKSFVSYLGIDPQLFKPINVSKENFVLTVGQCLPEKGFEFILRALGKIDDKIRPELVIVSDQGNIHWKNYLEKLAVKLGVKLRILNMITDEELIKLYNQAKLVVYAPYLEPFGLIPLEAMSCGTPVLAVSDGGVKETVIDGETGILTERDENMFAKEVIQLISNEKERKKLANNSIKAVNEFWTLEDSGKRLFNHLNRAMDIYEH